MKRALALSLALTLIALLGIVSASSALSEQEEQVIITEQLLVGDPSDAAGLTVTQRVEYDQSVRWTTDYRPGEPGSEETEFFFGDLYSEESDSSHWYYSGISISSDPGGYDQGYTNLEAGEVPESYRNIKLQQGQTLPDELIGINPAYHKLYIETEDGASGSEIIHLADYFDYYPLQFMIDVPGFDTWWGWTDAYEYLDYEKGAPRDSRLAINDYFRIPVMETETLELTIEKQSDGDLWSTGYGSTDSDSYQPWALAGHTDEAIWFTVNNRSQAGTVMDFSLVPGGYGIYRLPIPQDLTVEEQHLPNAVPLGQVETVCSLEDETVVTALQISLDQTRLYLTTLEEGRYYFSVYALEEFRLLQKTELASTDGISDYWHLQSFFYEQEELLILQLLNTDQGGDLFILLLPQEDDTFSLAFPAARGNIWEHTEHYSSFSNYAPRSFAWNGEKLAVIERLANHSLGNYTTYCCCAVSVFDETGLLYYSIMDHSLGLPTFSNYLCNYSYDDPLSVRWEEQVS